MHFATSFIACVAAASSLVAAAEWKKVAVTPDEALRLLARQDFDSCTGLSCASCFGAGNIVCAGNSCFNPDAGEQCCSDGSYCIGPDTSCCTYGPGEVGGPEDDTPTSTMPDFVPSNTFSVPDPTMTSGGDDEWDCTSSDSGEECCQRGGDEYHWCWGFYPTNYCYRPSLGEVCCSDGSVCLGGSSCCSQYGSVATTPNPADSAPSSTAFGGLTGSTTSFSSGSTATSSMFDLTGSTATATGTATTTGPLQVTAVGGAAARAQDMFAAVGVIGAGLALL